MDMFKIKKRKYGSDPKRHYALYIKNGEYWDEIMANATKSEILAEISKLWHYFK